MPPPPPSSPAACCSPPRAAPPRPTPRAPGLEVEDLPVGLVGYGAVGSRVARVLCAFGAQVMVYDPYVRGEIHGLRVSSLDQLLPRSRVITLHARLTAEAPRGGWRRLRRG